MILKEMTNKGERRVTWNKKHNLGGTRKEKTKHTKSRGSSEEAMKLNKKKNREQGNRA